MDYTNSNTSDYFKHAQIYRNLLYGDHISESHDRFGHSERHLQCVWFDPRLRPSQLLSAEGEPVHVVDPGRWNLEAGPDFRNSVLLIGKEKRRVCGDTEIHIASNDWTRHGHAKDSRYGNVRFHVTYYADRNPDDLPKGTLHVSLADGLSKSAGFHFEDIDLTAYPFNRFGPPTPCSEPFKRLSFETKRALLEAAGEERLRRKAAYFSEQLSTKTPEQVFYEQTLYALGFKNNRNPFRTLAARVPVAQLSQLDPNDAYAVLLGVSGLIPAEIPSDWPKPGRSFARACWDNWFRFRNEKEDQIMNRSDWNLANLRPLNHPNRRLVAAAQWFSAGAPLWEQIQETARLQPETFVKEIVQVLTTTQHPFWSHHQSWKSVATTKQIALVGKGRADAILINVITPMLATLKISPVFEHGLLQNLPTEPSNSIIRETAHHLFGPDHPSALYKSELARQGLIQLFQDHCLSGTVSCTECALPSRIRKLSTLD